MTSLKLLLTYPLTSQLAFYLLIFPLSRYDLLSSQLSILHIGNFLLTRLICTYSYAI